MEFASWLQFDTYRHADLLVVATLIVLEGLLSCDNAVVLALLVRDLPEEQRGRALRYGILGAYFFRFVALSLVTVILTLWPLKFLAGAYLVWMGLGHFFRQRDAAGHEKVRVVKRVLGLSAFWSTVVWVELTDIAFSVDSIAAAVAVANKMWILIVGGFLGILAMRFAAQGFVKLLDRFPKLESAAFAAVAFVGLKLCIELPADVLGLHAPFPKDAVYATAEEYVALADRYHTPYFEIPHTLAINHGAVPAPEREMMVAQRAARNLDRGPDEAKTLDVEMRAAESAWSLRFRPLFEMEGWASSLIVLVVFSFGFLTRRKPADS